MDKVIKLNAVNAGPYNSSQNIINFTIPQGGVYSLRDSYININTQINTTANAGGVAGVNEVYMMGMVWKDNVDDKIPNVSMIKDAHIETERQGRVEQLFHIDQLKTNLGNYVKTLEEGESDNYLNMNVFPSRNDNAWNNNSIFRDINKTGFVMSKENSICPVSIRLGDIFDFCNAEEIDTNRTGAIHIRVKCNLEDKLEAINLYDLTRGDIDEDVLAFVSPGQVVGFDGAELKTLVKFTEQSQIPYYVGQRIEITADAANTGGGTATQQVVQAVIKSIVWNQTLGDADQGRAILTFFNNPLFTALKADEAYTPIICSDVAIPASSSLEFDYAEIVLKEIENPQGINQISYNTYNTFQENGNGLQNYQQQFYLDGSSTNMVVFFPDDGELLSYNNDTRNYQLRLDNESLTDNRIVDFEGALQTDRINMTLNNMGFDFENLTRNVGNTSTDPSQRYTTRNNLCIIPSPLKQSGQQKMLQLSVGAIGTGIKAITLFEELPRVFSY